MIFEQKIFKSISLHILMREKILLNGSSFLFIFLLLFSLIIMHFLIIHLTFYFLNFYIWIFIIKFDWIIGKIFSVASSKLKSFFYGTKYIYAKWKEWNIKIILKMNIATFNKCLFLSFLSLRWITYSHEFFDFS